MTTMPPLMEALTDLPLHTFSTLQCQQLLVAAQPHGPVLAKVHADLPVGQVTAILGPNGAGKSTLLHSLVGLHPLRAGAVHWGGQPLGDWPAGQRARHWALMAQDTQVAFAFTAREVVELGRYPHRQQPAADEAGIVEAAMALTGVAHLAAREVATLSGGERARVHLARALAQVWHPQPGGAARWLLLDEPTAALDVQHQHQVMALLRARAEEQGMGVVAVLHDVNLALRYAHQVLLVPGGGAPAMLGTTTQVLTPERIAHVWGVPGEMVCTRDGVLQFLVAQPV